MNIKSVSALATALGLAMALAPLNAASADDPGKDAFLAQKCNQCHSVSSAAIVATVPGMVYEFEERADGSRAFTFASAGAQWLLGGAPEIGRAHV